MCPVCLATAAAIIAGKATAPGGFAVLVAHTFRKRNRQHSVPATTTKEDGHGHQHDSTVPVQDRLARRVD
jgi:hypothetical protein